MQCFLTILIMTIKGKFIVKNFLKLIHKKLTMKFTNSPFKISFSLESIEIK